MLLQCSENPKCAPAGPLEVQMLPIKYFLQLSMKNQFAGKFNNTMYLEAKFVSCCWLLSSDAAQGKIACGKERKTGEIPTLITSMGLDAMAPARPARKLALQKTARKQWQCVRGENWTNTCPADLHRVESLLISHHTSKQGCTLTCCTHWPQNLQAPLTTPTWPQSQIWHWKLVDDAYHVSMLLRIRLVDGRKIIQST